MSSTAPTDDEHEDIIFKKVKHMEFEFKMNHIKQILKIEIVGNFNAKGGVQSKIIYTGFYSFARCIQKSGQFTVPNSVGQSLVPNINVQISLQEK